MTLSKTTFVLFLSAASLAHASNFAVGGCKPNLPNYPTISAAVSDPATSGGTIMVCAGTYPEQVLITQPLTLEGVAVGGNSAAVIMPPGTALGTISSVNVGIVAYQVAVVNAGGPVNFKNIAVDGTGAVPPSDFGFLAGIFYQDASGSMTDVVTRNQVLDESGLGIVAASGQVVAGAQSITLTGSLVTNFDIIGVWILQGESSPLTLSMTSNTIDLGSGAQAALQAAGSGTVASNTINGPVGISNGNLTVSGNTIHGTLSLAPGGSNTVKSNHIDAAGTYGIELISPGTNVVESNNIVNASTAVVGCGNFMFPGASGDTVSHNTIVNSNVGISMPSGNTTAPNTFEIVPTAVQACP